MLIASHSLFIISGETWCGLKSGFGAYNWISPNHSWLEKHHMPSKILEKKDLLRKNLNSVLLSFLHNFYKCIYKVSRSLKFSIQ